MAFVHPARMSARAVGRPAICTVVAAALTLVTAPARADEAPIRAEYTVRGACPPASAFLAEIFARTSRAKLAAPGQEATVFQVQIDEDVDGYVGRLSIQSGAARTTRVVDGPTCGEVVSALALIAALTVDPRASTAARPLPASGGQPEAQTAPTAPAAPSSAPPLSGPSPPTFGGPAANGRHAEPQPPARRAITEPGPRRWMAGVDGSLALGGAPRPLVGGGPFLELRGPNHLAWALRLSFIYATTADFEVGPGAAVFVSSVGRLDACPLTWRLGERIGVLPCATVEGGVLRARGIERGRIVAAEEAIVPWAALALGLRLELEIVQDRGVIDAYGGPTFPLVRQRFVFEEPDTEIHAIASVAGAFGLGLGVRFP
jgi:hypothetical protein